MSVLGRGLSPTYSYSGLFSSLVLFSFCSPAIEPGASPVLGKHSSTELAPHPAPLSSKQ